MENWQACFCISSFFTDQNMTLESIPVLQLPIKKRYGKMQPTTLSTELSMIIRGMGRNIKE